MKVPLSWLREYVRVDASAQEIADALSISTAEVNGVAAASACPATSGSSASATCSRRRSIPNADRLQLTSVDVGEDRPYSDRLRRLELRRRREGRGGAARRDAARTG